MKTRKYYDYRKDSNERLLEFDHKWFQNKVCLDIGCSSGLITMNIAKKYHPLSILGIDIIESLIEEANKRLNHQSKNISNDIHTTPTMTTPATVTSLVPRSILMRPSSSSSSNPTKVRYPENCQFLCHDILSYDIEARYDTILCLNVIKWIHLHHGDEGLMKLFWIIWESLNNEGIAILEYQPWSSYIKNRNNSSVTKDNFRSIKIQPSQFEEILTQSIGFEIIQRLGTSLENSKGFNRPILILKKPQGVDYTRLEREELLTASSAIPSVMSLNETHVEDLNIKSKKSKKKRKHEEYEENRCHKQKISQINPPTEEEWAGLVDRSTQQSESLASSVSVSDSTSNKSLKKKKKKSLV